jgi:hypothetical protein
MDTLIDSYVKDFTNTFGTEDIPVFENADTIIHFFNKYSTFITVVTGIKFDKELRFSIINIYCLSYITYLRCRESLVV